MPKREQRNKSRPERRFPIRRKSSRVPGAESGVPVAALRRAYELMFARFGHQHWWPGETPFEVCVGAILTQNTSWTNVERAIANLQTTGVLEARKLFALPENELARLIRPAGYFNVKARRLRAFLRVLVEECGGELARLFAGGTGAVRERLLAIHGIGPETADSLLLYAGGHHSFVVDAYTKRIFARHRWSSPEADYHALKAICESALNERAVAGRQDYWQDYHAQLVMVGKNFCRPREPRCQECPLRPLLPRFRSGVSAERRTFAPAIMAARCRAAATQFKRAPSSGSDVGR
jgi:endonuclease III related protein